MASQQADTTNHLLDQLLYHGHEDTWLEVKTKNKDPEMIGQSVSAIANSAALEGRTFGYLVWGVADDCKTVTGTSFNPATFKKNNEPIESWLNHVIDPQISMTFIPAGDETQRVWILEIGAARDRPIAFSGVEYIPIGPTTKPLRKHPEKERKLWRVFDQIVFERVEAAESLTEDEVLQLLDIPAFYDLTRTAMPDGKRAIIEMLETRDFIVRHGTLWAITNLGAIAFAKELNDFVSLGGKEIRVVHYKGTGRRDTVSERSFAKGYANGFAGLIDYISARLPQSEKIGKAFREVTTSFPPIAIRELIANTLIHQDFSKSGNGPMIEIFSDRIEITNPGQPIVDVRRFVDTPSLSRNEKLARTMRMAHIVEERGSGWDKIAKEVELYQMPAPRIEVTPEHIRVTLLAPQPLTKMDTYDRIEAVFLHSCLRQVEGEVTTNPSIRERFGISANNSSQATRLLNEAKDANLIVLRNPDAGYKSRQYVPFWAT